MKDRKQDYMFSYEFFDEENKKFKVKDTVKGDCEIKHVTVSGRIDSYCYNEFLVKELSFPVLNIAGETIMSLSPMELQSHIIPIQMAEGRVGVGGLGLGYYVQNILEHAIVDEVVVYELNQNIIDIYMENFGPHKKLKIVNQDIRTVKNEHFDFFYNDIYPTILHDEVFNDMTLLCNANEIENYHFWTYEMALLTMLNEGYKNIQLLNSVAGDIYYKPFLLKLVQGKQNFLSLPECGEELYENYQFTIDNIIEKEAC